MTPKITSDTPVQWTTTRMGIDPRRYTAEPGYTGGGGAFYYESRPLSYLQNLQAVLGAKLREHYPLNEAAGAVVRGVVNHLDLAYEGAPGYGAAGIGDGLTSIDFNGLAEIDSYTAPFAAAFQSPRGYLGYYAAMNNPASWTDGNSYSLSYHGAGAVTYIQARKNVDGQAAVLDLRAGVLTNVTFSPPVTDRFFHLGFNWSSEAGTLTVFANGAQCPPASPLGALTWNLAAGFARFADTSPALANVPWPGRMAKITLCNLPLTRREALISLQAPGQIIIDGDSRSDHKRWYSTAIDDALPAGLLAWGGYGVASWAVSGDGWQQLIARAPAGVDSLIVPGVDNWLIVWAGVNDHARDVADIYADLVNYVMGRRAIGYRVALCTEIDASPAGWTAKYQALNLLIKADPAIANVIIDLGANPLLQDHTNAAIFSDGIHLTAAGEAAVAATAAAALSGVL